jgi:hypothetical protein
MILGPAVRAALRRVGDRAVEIGREPGMGAQREQHERQAGL